MFYVGDLVEYEHNSMMYTGEIINVLSDDTYEVEFDGDVLVKFGSELTRVG